MPRTFRTKIAPCTYQDTYGIDTVVQFRGEVRRARWRLTDDRDAIARWVQRTRSDLMDRAADAGTTRVTTRGTLAADIEAFFQTRIGRPGAAADKCHLAHWLPRIGKKRRREITRRDIDAAIAAWRGTASPQTIRHRCRVLRVLWRFFDGEHARTPLDDAQIPPKPHPHPVGVPIATVQAVLTRLAARCGTYRRSRLPTYARFFVLATTLQRPVQLERARPEDVDLAAGVWMVRSAKGAPSHPVALNADMIAAWRVFIDADAWGSWNRNRYRQALHTCGWPTTISTYNYRHAGAMDALERGADISDVQGLLGHTDITTTRRTYGPLAAARSRKISDQLAGRLTATEGQRDKSGGESQTAGNGPTPRQTAPSLTGRKGRSPEQKP